MTTEQQSNIGEYYIVHTYSGHEDRVKRNIELRIKSMDMESKIFDVIVPTEEEIQIKDGKRKSVQKRIFPGYIIVHMEMTDESWNLVRNTDGVTGFISAEEDGKIALDMDILLREGIYTWALGPSYETPAEIQDIISLGGDAVGMSTIPEMLKALELKLDVLGISCLTNYGAGMDGAKLSHNDVIETSNRTEKDFSKLILKII